MKVGYLLSSPYNEASGIWQKVLLQARAMADAGAKPVICSFAGKGSPPFPHLQLPIPQGGRGAKERALARLVEMMVEEGIEAAYLRRELWHPAFKRLMTSLPTVVEVNTKEAEEFKLTMSLPMRLYARLTRSSWRKYPAGYVSMTKELAEDLPKGTPISIIPNGIPRANARGAQSDRPHLFFSSTGGYSWHGIDKLLKLATLFPDWEFSFVGEYPPGWETIEKPRNLKCHGPLSATQADELLCDANIGVGTLALHRKSMDEACPLKLRSYLSYGLPSIIAYTDTDFSKGLRYICQLENIEDNIVPAKEKIREFVMANFQRPVAWSEVQFASEAEKGRTRMNFLRQVAGSFRK